MKGLYKITLLFLLLASMRTFAQCPPNIGFEDGTFNNWQCYIGTVGTDGTVSVDLSSPTAGRHTIYSKKDLSLDPYGHFPVSCPNGSNYSIRLGNSGTGKQAERVAYTYTVPTGATTTLILNYAVVLQNPDHAFQEQPRFTVKIYDVTDNTQIACPQFDFIASNDLPGFLQSDVTVQGALNVNYKEWSSTTINLAGYKGKQVRLEFTTNDCTKGGHFGYAYLDLEESCTAAITGNSFCNGQPGVTLRAPSGFDGYQWYLATDLTHPIGQDPTLRLFPAPPDNTTYALVVSPFAGVGCIDTLYTTVNKVGEDYKLQVLNTIYGCTSVGADLTAAAVTAGSSPGMTFSYYTDSLATVYAYTPEAAQAGKYYIRGVNAEGCLNILPVNVVLVDPPVINVNDPPQVDFPATADITQTFTHQNNVTYTYYSDALTTVPVNNPTAINHAGTYYVMGVNSAGCSDIQPIKVTVGPPKYTISAPNTFTPNNDGINDRFSISISSVDNVISFGSLKIYSRYGQLLFMSESITSVWDGTYKGKNLPTGTYYWVFDGINNYDNSKIVKASSITIIR